MVDLALAVVCAAIGLVALPIAFGNLATTWSAPVWFLSAGAASIALLALLRRLSFPVARTIDNTVRSATPTATLAPSVQRITLAPATGAIFIGQNLQMSATGLYSDGTQRDLTQVARWSSSDSSVISVNATGLISGQQSGTVTISASVGSVVGSMSIGCTAPLL